MAIETLIENVDNQIIKIRTRSLDVSFNELYDMYLNKELIISPDYQRLFRWGEEKQSRFIESLILEMPVPPIFVIETSDGIYELIDGLQRISSYLHFRGERMQEKNPDKALEGGSCDEYTDPVENQEMEGNALVLQGCDIVPDLNGLDFNGLPKALQIKLKRSFVRMEVIKKESNASLKYHMFKRLNTGGELLSAQEIRNCTIRLLDAKGITFLEKCSQNSDFKNVIRRIAPEKILTKYDQELVLRFFAIKNDLDNYKNPVTEFLTKYLEKMTIDEKFFDYEKEKSIFEKTFKFINDHWGEEAFSGQTKNGITRNEFIGYYFDGIAISLASLIEKIKESDHVQDIVEGINHIKYGKELQSYKTGNINAIRARIKLFTEGVEKILDGR